MIVLCCHTVALKRKNATEFSAKACYGRFKPCQTGKFSRGWVLMISMWHFSRTLTAVHDAILEDLVFPSEIVGKRIRVKLDGSRLIKVHLDKAQQNNVEHKVNKKTFLCRWGWHSDIPKRLLRDTAKDLSFGLWQWRYLWSKVLK